MGEIQIEIKNCNNIDLTVISLEEKRLNIKFAPNGTGKSTIARAILLGLKREAH
ncbi:MAG: AAA family ATPase [Nitrosomonas sp.]|uniref:AAA family ATPase n=1 Tax=Nitrosomonas sp. JL21 TaxID=153949 RepID=UPI00195FEB45|nr:AAA family ATPase [Nitrosomonas sp. JL21]MBL8497471.1 AAA family ATPase [Nitrosomonas sp.]MCC7090951.1 AAA family ATPase [Nitrosomonas sp.]